MSHCRYAALIVPIALTVLAGCEARLAALPEPATIHPAPRHPAPVPDPHASALQVPRGFTAEVVVTDLTYPTSVAFDDQGTMFIAEAGYAYGDPAAQARILKVTADGQISTAATRGLTGPINDLLWHNGQLYISHRGTISVLDTGGEVRDLVTGLPSFGDHHNNQLTRGPDGRLYFGQGTATNSGVVGLDNFAYGWLTLWPDVHDVPAHDIRLRDQTFATLNPFILSGGDDAPAATTGGFAQFGEEADRVVPGQIKANGSILSMNPNGSDLRVYAWGLRNPYGVMWGRDGQLYATENGFDDRGSRPIANDYEDLYAICEGAWYGWPDFASGIPVTDARFDPKNRPGPEFLMAEHPPVEKPLLTFAPHTALMKISTNAHERFGSIDHIFVAAFGHMTPVTGHKDTPHQGHRIYRIHPRTGNVETFIANRQQGDQHGGGSAGLRRPVDVVFSPAGTAMYVVDFGVMQPLDTAVPTVMPRPGTGVVWRIVPEGEAHDGPPAGLSVQPGGRQPTSPAQPVARSSNRD